MIDDEWAMVLYDIRRMVAEAFIRHRIVAGYPSVRDLIGFRERIKF